MPTRSIWMITTQKVLKTRTFKSMKQHYLGTNHEFYANLCGEQDRKSLLEVSGCLLIEK